MKVSFGNIDGNQWEEYCQKLFRLKYKDNDYQEIPARFGGDLGLEGFTKKGEAFQCFCPDGEPTTTELYDKQVKKITDDLRKLTKNERELKKIFGETKIKKWYLVTPRYDNKALLAHCKKKAAEVKQKKCSHLEDDFDVFIQTENDFLIERGILLTNDYLKVDVSLQDVAESEISDWIDNENQLYKTLHNKINRIPNAANVNGYIERNIKTYLEGQNMLNKLHQDHPALYEIIIKYKNAQEFEIENLSMIGGNNPKEFLLSCYEKYENLIKENLGNKISPSTIKYLSSEAIADWLIRCPLNF